MAHSNQTANYELSQFVANDKPTFLGDYNGDMAKIDAAIKAADNKAGAADTTAESAAALATSASTTATEAATDAATAAATATTALNTANNATTTAQNASTAAQSATTTASAAATKADAAKAEAEAATAAVALKPSYDETFARMFNMTGETPTATAETGYTIGANSIRIAKNADNSLCKVYGTMRIETPNGGTGSYAKIATLNTNVGTRESAFEISGFNMLLIDTNNVQATSSSVGLQVETNGTISIYANISSNVRRAYVTFPPCLYVMQDFGDTPTP